LEWTFPALPQGETLEYTCSVRVTEDFTNTVYVSAEDGSGGQVTDSDTAYVDAINPSIEIQKTPDEQAVQIGDSAHFTITVTNAGDVPLENVEVDDPRAPGCDRTFPFLSVGATETYSCFATATGGWTINRASVTANPQPGVNVGDSDEAALIFVKEPCRSSKKKATPPKKLLLQYNGTDPDVYIIVEHPKDGILFSGTVSDGGFFEASRSRGLNPDIYVSIYTEDPGREGKLIDYIQIHTSCSQPLYIGQIFGSNPAVATVTVKGEPI
jgi:uncharacterized repeat protein (TIGR01451 family)